MVRNLAIGALLVGGVGILAAVALKPGAPGDPIFVLGSPGQSAEALLVASEGREIGPDRPWIGFFAYSDDEAFRERLRENGALLAVPGKALMALCM